MVNEQGAGYSEFIIDQLDREHARRSSIDGRAAQVQQSVGLLLGLTATTLGLLLGNDRKLQGLPLILFIVALGVLTTSFLLALRASFLAKYPVTDTATLRVMVDEHWTDTHVNSLNSTSFQRILTIDSLRSGNDRKSDSLQKALWVEAGGATFGLVALGLVAAGIG